MKSVWAILALISASSHGAWASPQFLDPKTEGELAVHWQQGYEDMVSEGRKNLETLVGNPDDVIGIEFLLAEPLKGSIMSGFGHSMLRFVSKRGEWATDFVLSFSALVDEPRMSTWKGLVGGYKAVPRVSLFGEFWKEYASSEGRSIERFIIPTNARLRKHLLDTLAFWYHNPDQFLGSYTFANQNCSGLLTELLDQAGFGVPGEMKTIIPTHVSLRLSEQLMNVYPKLVIENVKPVLELTAKVLEISIDEVKSAKKWPKDAAEKLLARLSPRELFILLQEVTLISGDIRQPLIDRIKASAKLSLEEILGIRQVPAPFYELCTRRQCANQIDTIEESLWSETERKEAIERRLILLHEVEFKPEMGEFFTHLVKLTVAHEIKKDPTLEIQYPE